MLPKKTAAAYARFSTEKQNALTIDAQLAECRRYAEAHGLEIVREFSDEAASGASLNRPGLSKLRAEAKSKTFQAVIVVDLSRLSRDVGDTHNLIWRELAPRGVEVVSVTDGIRTSQKGSRLITGVNSVVADQFRQITSAKTRNALEERARAGFHAGGKVYGYDSIPEEDPPDPEHPRKTLRVNEAEAAIVRRIFREYAHRGGLHRIAHQLNAERVPAPTRRGWASSGLHSLLRQERYIGRVIWGKREWYVTEDGRRVPRELPEREWVVIEQPELRIVDDLLWKMVQRRHPPPQGGGQRDRRTVRFLSGLLRCGTCGGTMSVVSQRRDGLETFSQYGCGTHRTRGPMACANDLTVSERRLNAHVIAMTQEFIRSDEFESWVEEGTAASARDRATPQSSDEAELAAKVRAQEAEVEKIADALLAMGVSDTLKARLRAAEDRLRVLKGPLAAAARPAAKARDVRVDPDTVARGFALVGKVAQRKPAEARALLAAVVESVTCVPVQGASGRAYRVDTTYKNDFAALGGGEVISGYGCGGRI